MRKREKMRYRTEADIMKGWIGDINKPVVSVCCLAYNHSVFINECIDSILIQKTDFPFEIIIHDDASTDGTADIIRDYEKNFPNIIKPIYQNTNQYSKNNKPLSQFILPSVKGHYIALCECDDYWNDVNKLQIQYDFLRNNKEFIICYHNVNQIDQDGIIIADKLSNKLKKDFSKNDLLYAKTTISTQTAMFRKEFDKLPYEINNVVNEDSFLFSFLGIYGKGKFIYEINSACYRIHLGGVWSNLDEKQKQINAVHTYFWMSIFFARIKEKTLADYYNVKASKNVFGKSIYQFSFYVSIVAIIFFRILRWKS